ncbi:hypothetical protein [Noviherbaspirillum pedocola]|uniref:Formate dehydrogenase n=1 Tax=Noviherbaspirillum pedocola TaxID=2801341 RepID=A0A934W0U8_9BURK|nr:hypothetical protein [Noviherbaspirillum pedocola]MBK4734501.1 hypothetical protein [Noviherbaspirillum pedocola]
MSEQQKKARRGFFAGMGLLAAAGVAVKLSANVQTEAPQQAQAQEPEGNGYRLTEHIKKYYRTTTI